jgi:hypothetical protein
MRVTITTAKITCDYCKKEFDGVQEVLLNSLLDKNPTFLKYKVAVVTGPRNSDPDQLLDVCPECLEDALKRSWRI